MSFDLGDYTQLSPVRSMLYFSWYPRTVVIGSGGRLPQNQPLLEADGGLARPVVPMDWAGLPAS